MSVPSAARRRALRRVCGVGIAATVALSVFAPGTDAAQPTCLTPVAADGFEPPCNPFLSSPTWAGAHRNSYAQASSPFPAPQPGDAVAVQHAVGIFGVPLIIDFTEP